MTAKVGIALDEGSLSHEHLGMPEVEMAQRVDKRTTTTKNRHKRVL